jgi:hypothetical protein
MYESLKHTISYDLVTTYLNLGRFELVVLYFFNNINF